MRIATSAGAELIKHNLILPAAKLTRLYSQLTSGKRLQEPSDDPLRAVRVLRAQTTLGELENRKFVLQMGTQLIGATDTALGEISRGLSRCKDLAVRGSTATLGANERAAVAEELRQLAASLVSVGNTQVHGQYLFSGSQTDTVPFTTDESANLPVQYQGNHVEVVYSLTQSERAPVGYTGARVFNFPDASGKHPVAGTDQDVFSLLEDLAGRIEAGDVNGAGQLSASLSDCYNHAVSLRGQAGVVAQRYEQAAATAEDMELRLRELLSADQDVDYAEAIVDLRQQESVYNAALSMTSRLLEMPDLFDLPW